MNYVIFLINAGFFLFFCKRLKLIGNDSISVPGIYFLASFIVSFVLIVPSLSDQFALRMGFIDYSFGILLHTVMFGLGLSVAYSIINNGVPSRDFRYYARNLASNRAIAIFVVIYCIFLLLLFHQVISLGSIPIMEVFKETAGDEVTMARELEYKLRSGFALYLWHFSRMVLAPSLAGITFLMWRNKQFRYSGALFLFTLIVTCLNNALSSASAPVAMIFAVIAICSVLRIGKVKLFPISLLACLTLLFPFTIEYIYSPYSIDDHLFHFSWKIFNRFSIETFDRTLSYFDYYPYKEDYLEGRGTPLFASIAGERWVPVANVIFLERLDRYLPHLMHGNANAHMIGYLNAEVGLWGVAIGSFIVGGITGIFDIEATKNARSSVEVALYATLTFIMWKYMGSHPFPVWMSHGSILCIIIGYLTSGGRNRYNRIGSAATLT